MSRCRSRRTSPDVSRAQSRYRSEHVRRAQRCEGDCRGCKRRFPHGTQYPNSSPLHSFLQGLLADRWHQHPCDASDELISQLVSKSPPPSSGGSIVGRHYGLRKAGSARRRKSSSKRVESTVRSVALSCIFCKLLSWFPLFILPTHSRIHSDQAY